MLKINKIKWLMIVILSVIVLNNTILAVEVVNPNVMTAKQANSNGFMAKYGSAISGGLFLGIIAGVILGIFYFILWKIYKKIREERRKGNDLIFYRFKIEEKLNRINADPRLRKRNYLTFWLLFKRQPIYLKTENGLKMLGYYDGEYIKKESVYQILVYNKIGWFRNFTRLLLIPFEIKDIVSKELINKKYCMIIEAEGIDEVNNTDYYYMPLIKYYDKQKKQERLLDFSDYIQEEYFKKYVYRQVIKDTIISSRENIKDAVEMNPNIHFKRKSE